MQWRQIIKRFFVIVVMLASPMHMRAFEHGAHSQVSQRTFPMRTIQQSQPMHKGHHDRCSCQGKPKLPPEWMSQERFDAMSENEFHNWQRRNGFIFVGGTLVLITGVVALGVKITEFCR